MPRGNDSNAAAAEFRGQYGIQGNAEDLIQGNRAAYPGLLRTAQLTTINEKATADLDLDDLGDKLDLPDGASVIGAAVRGRYIVAVVETSTGHTYKEVLGADGEEPRAAAGSDQGAEADRQVAVANAEAAKKIAEATKEAERIIAEATEKAQEEASKIAQKAVEEAQAAAKEAAESDKENQEDIRQASEQRQSRGGKPQSQAKKGAAGEND